MEALQTLSSGVQQDQESLDELLFDPDNYDCDESFIVDTLDKATWATRKHLAAERRMHDRKLLADTYVDRIHAWLEKANKADLATQSFMGTLLDPFVRKYLEEQRQGNPSKYLEPGSESAKDSITSISTILTPQSRIARTICQDVLVVKKDISKTIAKTYLADGFEIPGLSMMGRPG